MTKPPMYRLIGLAAIIGIPHKKAALRPLFLRSRESLVVYIDLINRGRTTHFITHYQ